MPALCLASRKAVYNVLFVAILGLLPITLFGCTSPPPGSYNSPPPYPGATHVVDEDLMGKGLYQGMSNINRRITFETADSPEMVTAHYRDVLIKDGWRLVDETVTITSTYSF